jgi:hypothetical protein
LALAVAHVHAREVGREEGGLIAARARPDLEDRRPVVERIARQEQWLELLVELGDLRREPSLFRARLRGELRIGAREEFTQLGELILGAGEARGESDYR